MDFEGVLFKNYRPSCLNLFIGFDFDLISTTIYFEDIKKLENIIVGVKFEPTTRSAPLVCDAAMKRIKIF